LLRRSEKLIQPHPEADHNPLNVKGTTREQDERLILETRRLTKEYQGFVAVSDANLKVRRSTIHALIGPNGAGKTTFFELLTKFLTPTGGSIQFKGEDITHAKPAQIARRGIVRSFQIAAVFPHLTVPENVAGRAAAQARYLVSFLEGGARPGCPQWAGPGVAGGG
jgi:ABC-type branched-subunit amino acid transport system ATPase component